MASLAKTNKHLATAEQRKQAVRLTIATSSAIEGIYAPFRPRKTANKPARSAGKPVKKRQRKKCAMLDHGAR